MTKKSLYLALIILIFTGFGCLGGSPPQQVEIAEGQLHGYAINISQQPITNSTTYYLYSNKTIQAVISMVNASSLEIILSEDISIDTKSEKGPGIYDLVVVGNFSYGAGPKKEIRRSPYKVTDFPDYWNYTIINETPDDVIGNNVNVSDAEVSNTTSSENQSNISFSYMNYNATYSKSGREKKIILDFSQPLTGFAAYTYKGEYGYFYQVLSGYGNVTVVLPPDHDTGNIILGVPRPGPDYKLKDDRGSVRLVWEEPYPDHRFILVKYYRASLPFILGTAGGILLLLFLMTAFYFQHKIGLLISKREAIEKDIREKK